MRIGSETLIPGAYQKNGIKGIENLINDYSVNLTDLDGNTLLHHACEWNDVELVKYLIKSGARISKNNQEKTVLDIYKAGEVSEILAVHFAELVSSAFQTSELDSMIDLLKAGVSVTAVDEQGNTLLHSAVSFNNMELVTYLLDRGLKPTIKNKKKQTSMFVACRHCNFDLILLFASRGYGQSPFKQTLSKWASTTKIFPSWIKYLELILASKSVSYLERFL